jgi:hypothetical protein
MALSRGDRVVCTHDPHRVRRVAVVVETWDGPNPNQDLPTAPGDLVPVQTVKLIRVATLLNDRPYVEEGRADDYRLATRHELLLAIEGDQFLKSDIAISRRTS